ncbi:MULTISPECIES: tetratricopeptide repeat protein [Spirulina sp. CCY15215]|uniref:O-linked N-acetylglucosamine transferase, SPINDLY family protein n=1 Tax=Spirulina sp. CCY15215 TaxID=2767591 RepID=UPI0032AF3727
MGNKQVASTHSLFFLQVTFYCMSLEVDWGQCGENAYEVGDFARAAECYEQALLAEPEGTVYYWQLGLVLLLQGKADEAQTTWLLRMLEGSSEQVESWTEELKGILLQAAQKQEQQKNKQLVWEIRNQIQEVDPTDLDNGLHLLELAIQLGNYSGEEIQAFNIIELLQQKSPAEIQFNRLIFLLQQILGTTPLHSSFLELAEAILNRVQNSNQQLNLFNLLLESSIKIGFFQQQPKIAAKLAEFALRLYPKDPEATNHLARLYQDSQQHEKGIEVAREYVLLVESLADKIFASSTLLRALMNTGGHWHEARDLFQKHQELIQEAIAQRPQDLSQLQILRVFNSYFFAPYFQDLPRENRTIQNKIIEVCQENTHFQYEELIKKLHQDRQKHQQDRERKLPKRLKIGYLSACLKEHSVGWLARWLIQHHDREKFAIYEYLIGDRDFTTPLEEWYMAQADEFYKSSLSAEIANKIAEDKIDILIDLDSITVDITFAIASLKPAPIQITWLGWDASGLSTIDYFIADPYVLPDYAQEYYQEKIWRLPQTYIAVDGFEVGVPTLRRDDLDIEEDAVIYYSTQTGYKRHLETVRLQLKIIKEVPKSYFCIKGTSDKEAMQNIFLSLAEAEGIAGDRLRFLDVDKTESIHRANLGIMDIVLDTYPYNGATTTLETLWMGVPLVTRVGEQFSARNSYSMMMNAGITEGIAWSDEEYIEWGIRLGKDATLRQNIAWKLRQSRHTSPLWNGKQFAREMEESYQKMWNIYQQEN